MHDLEESIRSSALRRRGELIDESYRLGALLGIGGMGVVYAAIQCSLGRTVALKLPRPELASDPVARGRFRTEALAGSRINHRNVARVLDFGEVHGTPYLVMEYIAGPRLGDLVLKRGPLPLAFAIDLTMQILAGLQDAHANGIVHSDVKCDNILVSLERDGRVSPRLIDFGLARFVDEPRAACADGKRLIAGTAEYLAPELIHGEVSTFASDVYAAGALLYEMVSGATPFAGGTRAQVMCRQLDDDPVPLSWRAPDRGVSPLLDDLVVRALAKDPAARFVDAAAFGAALARVTTDGERARPSRSWLAAGSAAFSAEGATASMSADGVSHARSSLASEGPLVGSPLAERRHAVGGAILRGDGDAIAVAYLELSRALIDAHQLPIAITELEEGVELLSASSNAARRSPQWRLLLSLAALYDGQGDRARARVTTCAARDQAVAAGSAVGRECAERLWTRLARGDSTTCSPPPWDHAPSP
ncbi:MAG TPA: serine/threonine-protein kinase [Kofleriaceae bacterium]|nr:serine/threonine-protein kinase [Kofleriaceae bacterium]